MIRHEKKNLENLRMNEKKCFFKKMDKALYKKLNCFKIVKRMIVS